MVIKCHTEVKFVLRLERGGEISLVDTQEKSIPGRANSKYRGPEASVVRLH